MCDTCGCSDTNSVRITKPGKNIPGQDHNIQEHHSHDHASHQDHATGHDHTTHHDHIHYHDNPHDHRQDHFHGSDQKHFAGTGHRHENGHSHTKTIEVQQDALSQNNLLAEYNRGFLEARGIFALNLVSSPGSGKTSLLERTINDLKDRRPLFVIEGDQQSMNDANRIDAAGAPVIQINTGNGCHLDAGMIRNAIRQLQPSEQSLLFIENVGNLVCPALFDLGENKRVVIISVTEGDDKPLKYPGMFSTSDLCIINKTDLLPYVDFDTEKAKKFARRVQPDIEFIETSVRNGDGMDQWYEWLSGSLSAG